MYYVGIDLGGTNIAVGVCNEEYKIIARAKSNTNLPRSYGEICVDMARLTREAVAQAGLTMADVEFIGIGSPGAVNPDTKVVEFANNLGFFNAPIGTLMEELTGKEVFIENDANAAAYGEAVAGAAQGTNSSVTVTLGTGVGGGIVLNGKVFSGFNHFGAELGHTVIVRGGRECSCGRAGCWEAYASASALIYQTKIAMIKHPESEMWSVVNHDIGAVNGRTAFDAMRLGDRVGKEVVDKYIDYIACGIANMVNIFQPEVLCIGGGISKEGETLLAPIRKVVAEQTYGRYSEKQPRVLAAKLGDDAGIIGAAFLGRSVKNN
ncbi:MAG: ROK family protein [Clostridia bacterium]|nr:ROK family protein [Clostridia bacterium]